ncbi:CMRF35-like molecule 1 [Megalops cyprinoides]|uniref:CMRF35-like molecule 1 n=1 Tax=Megalops cyprinoides TaxID=118141 RepID=UPI00186491D6|nr:CMRF35-like molecule 1 [Megalops cyprinoides]
MCHCKIIAGDRPSHRVSITDDTTHQVFTVTMSRLDRTDTGWYWCALQKGVGDEKVPVYIRVTPEPQPQPQPQPEPIPTKGSSPLQSTVATVSASTNQSKAGAVSSCSNETLPQTPETCSKPEERSDSMTIVLVISGLLIVLLLAAVIFTLRMKRNMEENLNQKRNTQPSEFRRHEATKEQPSGEIQYSDISFLWETKDDTKPPEEPEPAVL